MQPVAPKTRLVAAERRAVVLDAALSVFARRGYEAASVAEIAEHAGVTKPVLYDHFASKADLYIALLRREAGALADVSSASVDPQAPLEERLRALAASTLAYARRRPAASSLLLQAPLAEPAIQEAHLELRFARRRAMAAAIAADPEFAPAPGLSRTASADLLGDLHSAVLERLVRWAIEHPRASVGSLSEVFVQALWSGLSGGGGAD